MHSLIKPDPDFVFVCVIFCINNKITPEIFFGVLRG